MPISKRRVAEFLKTQRFVPSKRMGQNFLVDQNVAHRTKKLVEGCGPFDFVLEIGPGLGAITEAIRPLAKKRYLAIEIDKRLAAALVEQNALRPDEILAADALETDWDGLVPDGQSACAVGNLPYSISSPLIFKFVQSAKFATAVFMLQEEMCERLEAKTKGSRYSAFGAFAQIYLEPPEKCFAVEPTAFLPAPKVMSRVCVLRKRPAPFAADKAKVRAFLLKCFNQRRKTLVNNLKNDFPKDDVLRWLSEANLSANARPQELSPTQFVGLMERLWRQK